MLRREVEKKVLLMCILTPTCCIHLSLQLPIYPPFLLNTPMLLRSANIFIPIPSSQDSLLTPSWDSH